MNIILGGPHIMSAVGALHLFVVYRIESSLFELPCSRHLNISCYVYQTERQYVQPVGDKL